MKQTRGERWVRWAGHWAVRQPFLAGMGLFFAALFLFIVIVITITNPQAALYGGWFWPVYWLIFTLIQFERREFYKIVQRLENRVSELEAKEESAVSFEQR